MVLMGIAGMRFGTDGVRFHPLLPPPLESLDLIRLPYRAAMLQIALRGPGSRLEHVSMDGEKVVEPFLEAGATGAHSIEIRLE
jgi:hypothetical protein